MTFPDNFLHSLQDSPAFEQAAFVQSHGLPIPVSIRLNPAKLSNQFIDFDQISWCKWGRYLPERPIFTLDPLFQAGTYYVQEASSMFLYHVLDTLLDSSETYKILDLCAAPGGKSTLIQGWLSANSLLVANEVIKNRANVLADNLTRWGCTNTFVTNNDPRDFQRLPGYFDVLVVDAPCSGSGLFRKDPEAMTEWSEQAVLLCSQRQKRILADAFDALAEGGTLIYSTCSYSKAENEDITDWLLDTFPLTTLPLTPCPLPAAQSIIETQSDSHGACGYRFYPDKVKGEGFFIAAFRKTDGDTYRYRNFKQEKTKSFRDEKIVLRNWLREVDSVTWTEKNGENYLLNPLHSDDFQVFQKNFYLRKAGVRLGKLSAKELIPDHELAMSTAISDDFLSVELDREMALKYLRKEEFMFENVVKTGWHLMRYQGHALGWAKILPNRINNYFPKDWRILMEL